MGSKSRHLLPLLVLGLLAPAPAAVARQTDAFDRPHVSGPLNFNTTDCGRRKTRNARGEVVVRAKSCVRFYRFSANRESNLRRNYGVVWLQTNVNATNGYCARSVRSDIHIPRRARLEARKPDLVETQRRRRARTRLVSTAGGSATRDAVIRRGFIMRPGKVRGSVLPQGDVFRTVWFGNSARKLAFISGIEISWRATEGPPQRVTSSLGYEVRSSRTC